MATKLTVSLTFDFDATSVWIADTENPAAISRGEFCAVAVPRILRLCEKYGIKGTFFTPGHTALAYPRVVQSIVDAGHEVAHHGWVHENPAKFDVEGERRILERGLEILERVGGTRPIGYRSPSGEMSPNTVSLLEEYGFLYESTCAGSDFEPYYLRVGDVAKKDAAYVFGKPVEVVEIPFGWILDDFPHMEFEPGFAVSQSAPSKVLEIWKGEFDYAYDEAEGGVFTLCMHPQVIGRGSRLRMLEEFIEYMQRDGVEFSRLDSFATSWRTSNPLAEWVARGSVHTGAGALSA